MNITRTLHEIGGTVGGIIAAELQTNPALSQDGAVALVERNADQIIEKAVKSPVLAGFVEMFANRYIEHEVPAIYHRLVSQLTGVASAPPIATGG